MKIFMRIITLLVLISVCTSSAIAQEVSVSADPARPIAGQSFKLNIEIETDSDEEPTVDFNQGTIEILGKSTSVGTYSSFVGGGGKISVVRKYKYSFDAMANRTGEFRISNIVVTLGTTSKKIPDYKIVVLKEAEKQRDVFIKAEPSKTKVFIGEGFDINYYIYYKRATEIVGYDQFPKLEGFVKRIIHDPTQRANAERITLNGEMYERVLQYTARLYPLKVGKSYIDSLSLKILLHNTQRSMFGGFGMTFSQPSPRSINSERVEIEVMPIPTANVPANFTGLVGDHEITLNIDRTKYLVNEPIEAKIQIDGPGALENYEAPQIFQDKSLEQFDIKSSLNTLSLTKGRKVFEYTYLPREQLQIPEHTIKLSFFDAETRSFIEKSIKIPELSASGGTFTGRRKDLADVSTPIEEIAPTNAVVNLGVIAPDFESSWMSRDLSMYLAKILAGILILLWVVILLKSFGTKKEISESEVIIKDIRKNGISYSRLHKLISCFTIEGESNISMFKVIESLPLSQEAKKYFRDLLVLAEESNYSNKDNVSQMPYTKKFFKELVLLEKRVK